MKTKYLCRLHDLIRRLPHKKQFLYLSVKRPDPFLKPAALVVAATDEYGGPAH